MIYYIGGWTFCVIVGFAYMRWTFREITALDVWLAVALAPLVAGIALVYAVASLQFITLWRSK